MEELVLNVERAVAGGRMLARLDGRVVLVWGAIPGERVRARLERAGKGVLFAETVEVLEASPDRRDAGFDWRCGGAVLAHVAYGRQLRLKGEIVQDAFGRIGRVPLPAAPDVVGSPERGYRMRARLHARGRRLGFFREGSHDLCSAASTGQLLPATGDWLGAVEKLLARHRLDGLASLEMAENIGGDERACHLALHAGVEAAPFVAIVEAGPSMGLSAARADRAGVERLSGTPVVTDSLHVLDDGSPLRLRRDARAFFQGNRFLVERLARHVVGLVPRGPVVDLYAGVGLFGLALASGGFDDVTVVEGDATSGADLTTNAAPFGDRVRVERRSVEAFLGSIGVKPPQTVIVDPPRTGLSAGAMEALTRGRPAAVIYVSCDPATLARDARRLVDGGYDLAGVTCFDLFPGTAHVETVATFSAGA